MIKSILEKVELITEKTLSFYFIGRELKSGVKKTTKILDKYKYHVYKADISEAIQKHLYDLTIKQLKWAIKKDMALIDYDPISESIDELYVYKLNSSLAFADVVTNQLCNKEDIKTVEHLSDIMANMELWAYTVGFCYSDEETEEWIYTFRKTSATKVATDEKKKFLPVFFDTENSILELIKGESINLDERIDCVFLEDTFYIFSKPHFERIAGIEEEFKQIATDTAKELKELTGIKGLEILDSIILEDSTIHRKMVRLKKTANYRNFTKKDVPKALALLKKFGETLQKDEEGDIVIANKKDFEQLMRVLVDFYKKGLFSGKPYGSYGGKELKEISN